MDEMITWYRQLNDGVKSLIKFLSLALVVGVICVIIINFFYAPMLVSGDSMRPASILQKFPWNRSVLTSSTTLSNQSFQKN